MDWIDVKKEMPTPIPKGDGTYCCGPNKSVVCAIWGHIDGEPWLQAWAKQRYCEDGQWRNGNAIGFTPTHWMAVDQAPHDFTHECDTQETESVSCPV